MRRTVYPNDLWAGRPIGSLWECSQSLNDITYLLDGDVFPDARTDHVVLGDFVAVPTPDHDEVILVIEVFVEATRTFERVGRLRTLRRREGEYQPHHPLPHRCPR